MARKIKFKIGTTLSGPVYMRQTDIQYGRNGKNIFTPEEVAAMDSSLYEVEESTPCEASILRESEGWRKDPSWQPSVYLREDAERQHANKTLEGYQAQTQSRNLTAAVEGKNATFTRGNVKITVGPDLKWSCNCGQAPPVSSGKDPQTMCTHLDTFHPNAGDQESFRQRTEAAYRKMGLSLSESAEAADIENTVMLESWTRIFGSREVAAQFLKVGKR